MNIFPDEEEKKEVNSVRIFNEMVEYMYEEQVKQEKWAQQKAEADTAAQEAGTTTTADPAQTTVPATGQTGTDILNDPDAAPPQEADNTDLAVPPQDTEKITGGEQLDDDGIANDDTDMIN